MDRQRPRPPCVSFVALGCGGRPSFRTTTDAAQGRGDRIEPMNSDVACTLLS
ncbi:hypothetical protein psal_cds_665 [Pandoravirus salinus]|uniref:Uncharacterized protein n=1 Tax=Pandoravirus salinus TaxID=1349410 RepID=S4VYP0_9VIRU|nr:hypothetical protein psal_cds_665 [Pandoravirus salinus]AGO84586.2 hypothetical protein psal_cds_665 [Pandoravirus salinus]